MLWLDRWVFRFRSFIKAYDMVWVNCAWFSHFQEIIITLKCFKKSIVKWRISHWIILFSFLRFFFLLGWWCHFVSKIYGNVCESGYLNELITISSENEHNSMKNWQNFVCTITKRKNSHSNQLEIVANGIFSIQKKCHQSNIFFEITWNSSEMNRRKNKHIFEMFSNDVNILNLNNIQNRHFGVSLTMNINSIWLHIND